MTDLNVPSIRFLGFSDSWHESRLGDYLIQHNEKSSFNKQYPVLTSSQKGIFLQKDYFAGKDVASEDTTGYNVVPKGYFTYRHMSDTLIFKFNINDIVDKGIVSTLYPVFNAENINKIFLLIKLNNGLEFRRFAEQQKQGGSRTYVYFNKLREMKINLPDISEQNKIADFFTSVDAWLVNLRQQKSSLEAYRKSIMQKIFSQETRFMDEDGNDYPEWKDRKIGEILKIGSGKDYKHLSPGKIPVFGTGGLMLHVDKSLYRGETVFIGRKGTINKPFYFDGDFWTVDTLFFTYDFDGITAKFTNIIFQNINWLHHNEASGVPSLSKTTIEKIKINLPCLSEQQKIVDFLSSIDGSIESKKSQIIELELWKKGLMQQMFV